MTIDRITKAQFLTKLRNSILSRTRRYDTGYGPVKDLVMEPVADVLEDQNNNRLRRVSLLLSLQNPDEFTEDDLNALVFNESIVRPDGSQAVATLTFRRVAPFATAESGIIPRGYPVGTSADESTGQATTFITTEDRDKTYAIAVIDPDTNQTVFEVSVPAVALVKGDIGRVGAERINRPLRPLVGYDSVTNKEASQEGRNRYSNAELIELYLLSVSSRQLSVPEGSEFHVRDEFIAVEDVHEVFGTDPLLTRAGSDAGAVDSYIVGESLIQQTDQFPFLGAGQRIYMSTSPVVRVDTVTRVTPAATFVEGEDYEVILDTSGVGGSTRARDAIRFLPNASPMPSVGDIIQIVYVYNNLIRQLQEENDNDPKVLVLGRDLLFRQSTRVDIFMTAELRVSSGFSFAEINPLVQTAILDFINVLGGGDDVEESDIQGEVRRISGVDNFIITRLVRSASATGVSDILISGAEHPRMDAINLIVTPV